MSAPNSLSGHQGDQEEQAEAGEAGDAVDSSEGGATHSHPQQHHHHHHHSSSSHPSSSSISGAIPPVHSMMLANATPKENRMQRNDTQEEGKVIVRLF